MPPEIDKKRCTKCGRCVDFCPVDVFFGSVGLGKKEGVEPVVSYPGMCWHCNWCVTVCPAEGAIRMKIPLSMHIPYK